MSQRAEVASSDDAAVGAARVLVVDDSPLVRLLVTAALADGGHETVEVSDGVQALEACRTALPDVVLLDVELPGLSGLEVLDRLREDGLLDQVPVVCLTGRTGSEDLVEALSRGAHDYLRKPFEPAELLARLSSALRVKRLTDQLRAHNAMLEQISRTDVLTGLPNRRDAERSLLGHVSAAQRHGTDLSVLMVDVDHFKQVNDRYGHPAGDAVLVELALRLQALLRAGDDVGRWGGEEFLVVLPMTPGDAAAQLGARLCAEIASHPVLLPDGRSVPIGVSIGSASGPADVDVLLRAADEALYAAKAAGRGRVVAAPPSQRQSSS